MPDERQGTEKEEIVPILGTYVPNMGTMSPRGKIADALFGTVRGTLLALFLSRPEEPLYVREVIRIAGAGQGAVQRELGRLHRAGILTRERRGRQVYYRADKTSPVYPELRGLVLKTLGLVDVLRAALMPAADDIDVAFVFGSLAKGTADGGSDVDVMIIGEVSLARAATLLAPTQDTLGREVNPSVYPAPEFAHKAREGQHFVATVLREPRLYVMGDDDDLERVAGEGLAH